MNFLLPIYIWPIFRLLNCAGALLRAVLPRLGVAGLEWYIKLFLGVHFADNLA